MVAGIFLQEVTHQVSLAFMHYLLDNQCTYSNIAYYLTGIRAYFVVHGCDTTAFRHEQLQYFQKSVKLHTQFKSKPNTVITSYQLERTVYTFDTSPHSAIFKPLYLFTFFSFFLRFPNLLPHTMISLDPTR